MTDGNRTFLAISEGWGDTSVESIDVEWLVPVVSVERSEVSLIEDDQSENSSASCFSMLDSPIITRTLTSFSNVRSRLSGHSGSA